jgi:chaperonin cofactor prefoldin
MTAINITPELKSIIDAMKAHIKTLESDLTALRQRLKLCNKELQAVG